MFNVVVWVFSDWNSFRTTVCFRNIDWLCYFWASVSSKFKYFWFSMDCCQKVDQFREHKGWSNECDPSRFRVGSSSRCRKRCWFGASRFGGNIDRNIYIIHLLGGLCVWQTVYEYHWMMIMLMLWYNNNLK